MAPRVAAAVRRCGGGSVLVRAPPDGGSHEHRSGSAVEWAIGPVGLDALLAHLLGDLALLANGLGVQTDALLGDRLLFHDRLLPVEDHLVLLLGDLRA
jgi:hypothetical protein